MRGFVQGADRQQTMLFPECLDDWVDESNSIRAVDVFVDALKLRDLGFDGVDPAATGRPAYHPSPMLKLYIYGYLNRVQSSRRLERASVRARLYDLRLVSSDEAGRRLGRNKYISIRRLTDYRHGSSIVSLHPSLRWLG